MNHKKDEILRKYIAGEIEIDQEKYKILELDKEDIQKKFSFLNRWVIFKKID